jgi:hypothetical protein
LADFRLAISSMTPRFRRNSRNRRKTTTGAGKQSLQNGIWGRFFAFFYAFFGAKIGFLTRKSGFLRGKWFFLDVFDGKWAFFGPDFGKKKKDFFLKNLLGVWDLF